MSVLCLIRKKNGEKLKRKIAATAACSTFAHIPMSIQIYPKIVFFQTFRFRAHLPLLISLNSISIGIHIFRLFFLYEIWIAHSFSLFVLFHADPLKKIQYIKKCLKKKNNNKIREYESAYVSLDVALLSFNLCHFFFRTQIAWLRRIKSENERKINRNRKCFIVSLFPFHFSYIYLFGLNSLCVQIAPIFM